MNKKKNKKKMSKIGKKNIPIPKKPFFFHLFLSQIAAALLYLRIKK
jgi:hypothetical protein